MPVTQLRISTCYFILHCRSHSATQWNKLQRLINCANPAMRMFAAKCKQKKEVPWGSIARSTRTADSTYSTSPNVPTEWSALTARQRTSRTSDQHIQHVKERRKRVISTYSTSKNVANEWSAHTTPHWTSQQWSALTERQRTSQTNDQHSCSVILRAWLQISTFNWMFSDFPQLLQYRDYVVPTSKDNCQYSVAAHSPQTT